MSQHHVTTAQAGSRDAMPSAFPLQFFRRCVRTGHVTRYVSHALLSADTLDNSACIALLGRSRLGMWLLSALRLRAAAACCLRTPARLPHASLVPADCLHFTAWPGLAWPLCPRPQSRDPSPVLLFSFAKRISLRIS